MTVESEKSVGAASDGDEQRTQLRAGVTPTWAVFGVSLGVLAPASTLGLALGTIAASAGAMSWVTWLLTSVLVLGFGGAIAWLARRFTSTGGTYGLTAHTGNRPLAFLVLIAQIVAILVAGPACVIGAAIYLQAWLVRVGVHGGRTPILVAAIVVLTLIIAAMCLREISVSAKVLLAIEFLTVGVICVLFVIVLVKSPVGIVDRRQFHFHGVSLTTILAATAFSVYSMAGFDHAATLGREARQPKRAISVAVLGSLTTVGILYVVGSYVMVLGFRDIGLPPTSAPLDALATRNGTGWLGYIIDLGVAVSFFGAALGIMAGTSRTLFTIAKDGLLPRRLAQVSPVHRAPVVAVAALVVFYLVVGVAGCLLADADTSYGVLGTYSGYWLVVAYGVCALAAGLYALRSRTVGVGIIASALLGIAGLVIVFYYSFHPFPEGTYRTVAWVFIATIAATLLALIVMLATRARALTQIGSTDRSALVTHQ